MGGKCTVLSLDMDLGATTSNVQLPSNLVLRTTQKSFVAVYVECNTVQYLSLVDARKTDDAHIEVALNNEWLHLISDHLVPSLDFVVIAKNVPSEAHERFTGSFSASPIDSYLVSNVKLSPNQMLPSIQAILKTTPHAAAAAAPPPPPSPQIKKEDTSLTSTVIPTAVIPTTTTTADKVTTRGKQKTKEESTAAAASKKKVRKHKKESETVKKSDTAKKSTKKQVARESAAAALLEMNGINECIVEGCSNKVKHTKEGLREEWRTKKALEDVDYVCVCKQHEEQSSLLTKIQEFEKNAHYCCVRGCVSYASSKSIFELDHLINPSEVRFRKGRVRVCKRHEKTSE